MAIGVFKKRAVVAGQEKEEKSKSSRNDDLKKNYESTDHKGEISDLVDKLGTDITHGLTQEFAARRLLEDGKNQLTPPPETPWWQKFFHELFGNKFSLLLWAGSVLCFVGYSLDDDAANLYLGIVLAVVVFVTGCFSYFQNAKSEDLMKSFASMSPPQVKVIREGKLFEIPSADIVRGDVIKMEGGDLVPADCRVVEASDNLVVDNAALTGESEPQKRRTNCTHEDPLETQNLCFFGTSIPEGSCTAIVCQIGDNTLMGKIAGLALGTANVITPINREIQHFIMLISGIALVIGVTFFAIGFAINPDPITNLVFMVGIIVANVPEGLLATVTVCLTLTAKRMHKKQVLVKNLEGVETLGSTSCICSDKTGTLTQNIMTVCQLVYGSSDGTHIEDCESSFTKGHKTYDEDNASFKRLQRCASLNNTAQFNEDSKFRDGQPVPFKKMKMQGDGSAIEVVAWKAVGNASEIAMLKFCQPFRDVDSYRAACPDVFKIPFNSKNKYQVHVVLQEEYGPPNDNQGPRVVLMKGAPERIIERCDSVLLDGVVVPMTAERRQIIEEQQESLSRNGLRVLGFAEKELPLAEYPADYKFNDGKDEGYSTPNFPLGEFHHAAKREEMEKAGAQSTEDPIHPKSKPGLVFIGMMALIDPPREAVPGAVAKCKTAGIKVIMVTGDHPVTAQAIAYKVGILWSKTRGEIEATNRRYGLEPGDPNFEDPENAQAIVVPGWEISHDMAEEKWDAILEHPQIVFARTSPQQKLVIVDNNQRNGHIVAVTGDGVNDSPALKKADIGIAMGIMGSSVSKQAADMILLDDNFASIVSGVEEGRLIFDNLKKSIAYTLSSKIPEMAPFLCYIIFQTPLPLTTVLILAIDLGTDMVPAISMSYETPEADIMRRPPRNAALDRLVTKKLVLFAYLQIGIIQAAAGFFAWMVVMNDYGYPPNILVGLGASNNFGRQPLFCRFHGGQYVSLNGIISQDLSPTVDPPTPEYPFWDPGAGGYIIDCEFPVKLISSRSGVTSAFDFRKAFTYLSKGAASTGLSSELTGNRNKNEGYPQISVEAVQAMVSDQFFPYTPWASRMSSFWRNEWLAYDIDDEPESTQGGLGGVSNVLYFASDPAGVYSTCLSDPAMSDTGGTPAAVASGSRTALEDAEATGATILELMYPYNQTVCNEDAKVQFKVQKQATFCNGDGTVEGCEIFEDWDLFSPKFCSVSGGGCYAGCAGVNSETRKAEAGCEGQYGGSCDWNSNYRACQDIANRMSQYEALSFAQTSFFVAIVIVQWADLLICKTRWLSLSTQGLGNATMNFGLYFETLLSAWLLYSPPVNLGLGTRPLRLVHWFPALPFSLFIFCYDEVRKYLMRMTSIEKTDPSTGQAKRVAGWLERNTYY